MSDRLIEAEGVELVLDGDVEPIQVEEFALACDNGVEDAEPTCIAAGKTEYEFTIAFEPTPRFILWLLGLHAADADDERAGGVSDE